MNVMALQSRLGKISLGSLSREFREDIIEKINSTMIDTMYVDENTTGSDLLDLYEALSNEDKTKLRSISLIEDSKLFAFIEELERIRTNDSIMQEKDDTIKDTFTGAIVFVIVLAGLVIVYSYTSTISDSEAIETSNTIFILSTLANIIKSVMGIE